MTSLTVNGSAVAATTLAAAGKLFNATGGTSGNTSTKVGTSTQFKQIFAKGTTTNQTGVASLPAPTDSNFNGWMWDVTTLEGQTIAAGTWTPTFHLLASTGTTITPTVQWYKRSSAGAYTSIGSVAGSSIALTTSSQALTFTPPSLSSMDFATGDKLVMWLWVNQTAGGATNSTISVVEATSGSTAGVASQVEAVTPGYAPTPGVLIATCAGVGTLAGTLTIPILVLYGSKVADATLTNACDMASATGGVETSAATVFTSTGNFGEVWSKGNASLACVSAIPAAPTGHGWVYAPGAGTFVAGNWSATVTESVTANNAGTHSMRFFQLPGGVLASAVSIGTLTFTPTATAKTTYNLAAVSMASVTFAATDLLYVDYWYQDSFGAASDTCTMYESNSAVAGVTGDMVVTTAAFNPSSGVVLSATCAGVGTLAGTFTLATTLTGTLAGAGTAVIDPYGAELYGVRLYGIETLPLTTALTASVAGAGTLAGTLSANVALTSTLAGAGTLSGTLSTSSGGVALTATMAGMGTLAGTFQLSTSLTDTIASIGTLTPTLTASLALPATTIPGVGTLAGTLALKTALTTTLAGTGTLTATVTEKTALTVTLSGVGTLSGTLSTGNTAALSATCAGAGTLSGSLTLGTALTTTLAGVGTLSGTSTLKTALTSTIAGTGTLAGTLSAGMALSPATIAGVGTLSGSLAYTVVLTGALAGTGTLSGTPGVRVALSLICAGMGTLAGIMSLFNTLAQPGIALVLDSLYHQAALGDSLVGQATASDALRGQATTSDALLNQATTSDVSPGSALLSDQG